MNQQIARLALIGIALIAALIVATTYWQTWAAAGLADRQDNEIQRVAQFSVKRGLIRAADGTILATNRRKRVNGQTLYFRRYPTAGLFAQIVGYSTQSRSRTGLEASENDYLTGSNTNLKTIIDKTLNRLRGATIKGNDLWLTLRPTAQRLAMAQLAGKCGAAVALELLHHAQRMPVVAESLAAVLALDLVERLLARVPERRVAHVVPEPHGLDEILVQAQRSGDPARDPGRLQGVREARPEVVAAGVDEDLRLVPEPAERLRVDDPVAVALERRPQAALLLRVYAAAALVRAHGERREPPLLVLSDGVGEAVGNSPGELGHRGQRSRSSGRNNAAHKKSPNRHERGTDT